MSGKFVVATVKKVNKVLCTVAVYFQDLPSCIVAIGWKFCGVRFVGILG